MQWLCREVVCHHSEHYHRSSTTHEKGMNYFAIFFEKKRSLRDTFDFSRFAIASRDVCVLFSRQNWVIYAHWTPFYCIESIQVNVTNQDGDNNYQLYYYCIIFSIDSVSSSLQGSWHITDQSSRFFRVIVRFGRFGIFVIFIIRFVARTFEWINIIRRIYSKDFRELLLLHEPSKVTSHISMHWIISIARTASGAHIRIPAVFGCQDRARSGNFAEVAIVKFASVQPVGVRIAKGSPGCICMGWERRGRRMIGSIMKQRAVDIAKGFHDGLRRHPVNKLGWVKESFTRWHALIFIYYHSKKWSCSYNNNFLDMKDRWTSWDRWMINKYYDIAYILQLTFNLNNRDRIIFKTVSEI